MSMEIKLQLDPVAMREATSQAIMGILTPEIRATIIQQAISALLAPSTNSWERGKTPIEAAFTQAVMQIANQSALTLVKDDIAVRNKLDDLLRETANKILNADREKLATRMADAFISSIRRD
jgi:hypothetical protein